MTAPVGMLMVILVNSGHVLYRWHRDGDFVVNLHNNNKRW
jgi:hypothetical protein